MAFVRRTQYTQLQDVDIKAEHRGVACCRVVWSTSTVGRVAVHVATALHRTMMKMSDQAQRSHLFVVIQQTLTTTCCRLLLEMAHEATRYPNCCDIFRHIILMIRLQEQPITDKCVQ